MCTKTHYVVKRSKQYLIRWLLNFNHKWVMNIVDVCTSRYDHMAIFTVTQLNSSSQCYSLHVVFYGRWWANTVKTKNAMKNYISIALLSTFIENRCWNEYGVMHLHDRANTFVFSICITTHVNNGMLHIPRRELRNYPSKVQQTKSHKELQSFIQLANGKG